MPRWFPLATADEAFVASAPQRFVFNERLDAPVAQVWESLASDRSLADWGPMVSSVTWQDEQGERGVGTRREVALLRGVIRVREQFTRWDAPAGGDGAVGYTFHGTAITAPGLARFAEDYVLEPDGDATRLRWTVAVEARSWARLPITALAPLNRAAFGRMAADGRKFFART